MSRHLTTAHVTKFKVDSGRGIRASCSCGWAGEWRPNGELAGRDSVEHLTTPAGVREVWLVGRRAGLATAKRREFQRRAVTLAADLLLTQDELRLAGRELAEVGYLVGKLPREWRGPRKEER